ncbi:MAG: cache domain-containing protein [Verrucomicrobia bacterium]|nr:cache domain-containing protein [Deltaproteobacteria bacterium]
MQRVRISIRRKLLFATLTPLCVAIVLCWFIGAKLITDRVFRQAQQTVISDLTSARKVYQDEIQHLTGIVKVAALSSALTGSLRSGRHVELEKLAGRLLKSEQLSFLNLIDNRGVVRHRAANPLEKGDLLAADPLIARALGGSPASGTQVYTLEQLARNNPALAQSAALAIKATPRSRPSAGTVLERGLMLVAAAPLRTEDGRVIGVLQAGLLLNNDERVVDAITRIVYDREVKGAATVFLGDVRIATSVRDGAGNRATGTLMSAVVAVDVLERGRSWNDRAFVLNDWFISAYEPIRDPEDKVIGALYVGMPERPFLNIRSNLNLVFTAVLLFVSMIGVTLSTWISSRLARPVRALAEGARRIAAGEHIEPIAVSTHDEIGLLADEFNTMNREVNSLKNTLEQKVVERTTQLEEKNQQLLATQKELAKAERLSGLGLLAAGVAHEINNPLAVIRGNAELLQDEIPAPSEEREEVEAIMVEVGRIERIVNNLRVFSRSGLKRITTFSLGGLLDEILDQVGHQIALEPFRIERAYWGRDVAIEGDKDQIRQVFTNLIVNGLQAMDEGGVLMLDLSRDETGKLVSVTVADSGRGIMPEHLEKLFTPFFTTKPRGTGLGLAVSYGIVKDHGGEIRVSGQQGEGAVFTVILPFLQAT